MADRPTSLPVWATDTNFTNGPDVGNPTKEEPSAGQKAEGHVPDTRPAAQFQNWWQNLVYSWLAYFDQVANSHLSNWVFGTYHNLIDAGDTDGFLIRCVLPPLKSAAQPGDWLAAGSTDTPSDTGRIVVSHDGFLWREMTTPASTLGFTAIFRTSAGTVLFGDQEMNIARMTTFTGNGNATAEYAGAASNVVGFAQKDVSLFTILAVEETGDAAFSIDDGQNWNAATPGGTGDAISVIYDPVSAQFIVSFENGTFRKSASGSASWSAATTLPDTSNDYFLTTDGLGTIVATRVAGSVGAAMYVSIDGAVTWLAVPFLDKDGTDISSELGFARVKYFNGVWLAHSTLGDNNAPVLLATFLIDGAVAANNMWQTHPYPFPKSWHGSALRTAVITDVAYGQGRAVLVGGDPSGTYAKILVSDSNGESLVGS